MNGSPDLISTGEAVGGGNPFDGPAYYLSCPNNTDTALRRQLCRWITDCEQHRHDAALTTKQRRVLDHIRAHNGRLITELSKELEISRTELKGILNRLSACGLVCFSRLKSERLAHYRIFVRFGLNPYKMVCTGQAQERIIELITGKLHRSWFQWRTLEPLLDPHCMPKSSLRDFHKKFCVNKCCVINESGYFLLNEILYFVMILLVYKYIDPNLRLELEPYLTKHRRDFLAQLDTELDGRQGFKVPRINELGDEIKRLLARGSMFMNNYHQLPDEVRTAVLERVRASPEYLEHPRIKSNPDAALKHPDLLLAIIVELVTTLKFRDEFTRTLRQLQEHQVITVHRHQNRIQLTREFQRALRLLH